jgi:hypothetical protein
MQSPGGAVARTAEISATSPAFLVEGAVRGDHKRTRGRIVAGVGAETSPASGHDGGQRRMPREWRFLRVCGSDWASSC